MGSDSATGGVGLLAPGGRPPLDGAGTLGREVLVEHAAVPVGLLGVGDVVAPVGLVLADGGLDHLLVGDHLLGLVLEAVDPAVADAVGELLLLSPQDVVGEVGLGARLAGGVEGLAHDVLLDAALVLLDQLLLGVDVHGNVKELLVEERNAGFDTPCRGGLVGAQAVGQVQVLDPTHGLLVEGLLVGRVVEVEVATEGLVRALARKDHLDTHGLDLAGEQEHGC